MNSEKLHLSIGPLFSIILPLLGFIPAQICFHLSVYLTETVLNWEVIAQHFVVFSRQTFQIKKLENQQPIRETQLQFILLIFQWRNYDGKIKTCLAFYTSVYKIQCQTVSYEKLCQIDLVRTNMRKNVDSKRATLW